MYVVDGRCQAIRFLVKINFSARMAFITLVVSEAKKVPVQFNEDKIHLITPNNMC